MADFVGYPCWKDEQINAVINTEAIGLDRDIFLATHVPFDELHVRSQGFLSKSDAHEIEILDDLMERASEERDVFTVVKGLAGSGKSHFIRWFYLQYRRQVLEEKETVVLIRRMDNNLKSTLEAILKLDIFPSDDSKIAQMRSTLESAHISLSDRGVANSLRNSLQEIARSYRDDEIQLEQLELPFELKQAIPDFLSEPSVANLLIESEGFKRVIPFLIGGKSHNHYAVEEVGFIADDFRFVESFENQVEDLNSKVRDFVKDLIHRPKTRSQLATFLNRILNNAVSQMTQITPELLTGMFRSIREELKTQGRNLALFIEDITAFTGLDQALLDVLIAPHQGTEMCRLFSMIGITDGYYQQNLRDNIKQRAMYTISLDDSNDLQRVLKSREDVITFSSRYLNALRLTGERIKNWYRDGGDIRDLPNACEGCEFLNQCHSSFGNIIPNDWNTRTTGLSEIGLYPFNANALWTMFDNMNASYSRTPRTLLDYILATVMRSHRNKISSGSFPPAPKDVGGEHFRAPSLANLGQRAVLGNGVNADRAESLIVFWGNRSADVSVDKNGIRYIGGVPESVFEAFQVQIPRDLLVKPEPVATKNAVVEPIAIQTLSSKPAPLPPKAHPYKDTIVDWQRDESELLQSSSKILSYVRDWLRTSIDWLGYNVPEPLQAERISLNHFKVEDEARQVSSNYVWHFTREDADLFNALCDLNYQNNLSSDDVATYIQVLSTWLNKNEKAFVQFVKQPGTNTSDLRIDYTFFVTANLFGISVLVGNVPRQNPDNIWDWYQRLITLSSGSEQLKSLKFDLIGKRSSEWLNLMERMVEYESDLLRNFQKIIDVPQGRGGNTEFFDPTSVLDSLQTIKDYGWILPPIGIPLEGMTKEWYLVIEAYHVLQGKLIDVLHSEQEYAKTIGDKVWSMLGGDTPEMVDEVVRDFNKDYREQIPRNEFNSQILDRLRAIDKYQGSELFAQLSRTDRAVDATKKYDDYLQDLYKAFDSRYKTIQKQLAQRREYSEYQELQQQKEKVFRNNSQLARDVAEGWDK